MAHTRTSGPFNSTPFSSCCGIASTDYQGKPAGHCHGCGGKMDYHDSGVPPSRGGVCGMCGRPYKGGPQDAGACNC